MDGRGVFLREDPRAATMASFTPTGPGPGSASASGSLPRQRPRWAFWKGLATGVLLEIPLLAVTVWCALAVLDAPAVPMMRIVRLTAVFAGIAALFTAGGVGRLAAYTSVELGRRWAVFRAARAHAVASAGLIVIATIPHGAFPATPWGWVALATAGFAPGALCGAAIGVVCSRPRAVPAEAWSPRPGTLRQLLGQRDLSRLGSALRSRTSHLFEGMFEGMFDPVPPPPADPAHASDPTATAPGRPATPVERDAATPADAASVRRPPEP